MSPPRLFSILMMLPWAAAIAAPKVTSATVAYVVDGDTAVLEDGATVHYLGIEVPTYESQGRSSEPYGREAFELNKRLVAGKRVRLEYDAAERDGKGDLQAYVYADRYFVNASLLSSGFARAAVRSPNTRHAGLFEKLQAEAKEKKRGVWKLPRTAAPVFGNKDLAAEGALPPSAVTNKDLEKYDVPGEPEGPPEPAEGASADTRAPEEVKPQASGAAPRKE